MVDIDWDLLKLMQENLSGFLLKNYRNTTEFNKFKFSLVLRSLYYLIGKDVISQRRYVRVVKETDLKSVGLRPRRFEPCCRRLFLFLFLPFANYSSGRMQRPAHNKQGVSWFPWNVINGSQAPNLTKQHILLIISLSFSVIQPIPLP